MQPSALEPGTISRKRPEPQGAIVPFAGSSTDVPAKKARTIKKTLQAPRASQGQGPQHAHEVVGAERDVADLVYSSRIVVL